MQAVALSGILATTALAAPHPFYQSMLQRGVAQAQEGRYADAIRSLRIAAFGSLDDLKSYQLAQVHLAIAHEKLGSSREARLAATKFVQAERLQPSYEQLALSDATRETFEKIVAAAVEPHYLAQVPAFRRSTPKPEGAVAARGSSVPVQPAQPEKKPEATVPPPQQEKQQPKAQTPSQPVAKPAITTPAPMQSATAQTTTAPANSAPTQIAIAPPVAKPGATATATTPAPQQSASKQPARMQSASAHPTITAAKPQPAPPVISSEPAKAQPQPTEVTLRLAEAQRSLNEGKLLGARNAYLALSQRRDVPRPQLLEIARGLNRTGAWQESAMIYQRALPLLKGEELHMFYEAVNRYELGELTLARTLLARALPSLPQSREVEVYRVKIQGAS